MYVLYIFKYFHTSYLRFYILILKYPENSNHMSVTLILLIMLKEAKFKLSIKTEKKHSSIQIRPNLDFSLHNFLNVLI